MHLVSVVVNHALGIFFRYHLPWLRHLSMKGEGKNAFEVDAMAWICEVFMRRSTHRDVENISITLQELWQVTRV